MINPPPGESTLRIMSTDPGSNTAGFSIVDVDLVTRRYDVRMAHTYKANHILKKYGELRELHEERFLRNLGYGDVYREMLLRWSPHTIASETAYMGRFAAAFKALTEQITIWRAIAYNWNPTKTVYLYEPSSVKQGLKVNGKSNDKELMRKALDKRSDIIYHDNIKLSKLDEHEIDSICVAIHHAQTLNMWLD